MERVGATGGASSSPYEKRVGIVQFWMGWCEARLVKYFTAWALIIIGLSTD